MVILFFFLCLFFYGGYKLYSSSHVLMVQWWKMGAERKMCGCGLSPNELVTPLNHDYGYKL